VDYKTGKPKKPADAKKDIQLSIYSLAAREILELNQCAWFFTTCKQRTPGNTRDSKQLDEAQKTVQAVASEIRAASFPPRPGYICRVALTSLSARARGKSLHQMTSLK